MVVEREKAPNDKGKYLLPELFGQPRETAIHYIPAPKPSEEPPPAGKEKLQPIGLKKE
jgi:hypothetical protein